MEYLFEVSSGNQAHGIFVLSQPSGKNSQERVHYLGEGNLIMGDQKPAIGPEECDRLADLTTALSELSLRVQAGETLTEEDWKEISVILAGLRDVLEPALYLIKERLMDNLKK